jgi:type IV secretory pathway VirB10-like protein
VNRSPLFYPMARGTDSEAGGAADLQTDVMRFMAILSLCLMVIFAVVQSVPVESIQAPEPATTAQPMQTEVQPRAPVEAPPPVETRQTVAEPQRPPAQAVAASPAPTPQEPQPATTQEGFTLRFETDQALTQLVARGEVGLYAITSGSAMRMTVNQDKAEFWSAPIPGQYHEMDTTTVPMSVIRALQQSTDGDAASTRWGVTLPAVMSGKLRAYMQDYRGGSLVIGANGILRMDP